MEPNTLTLAEPSGHRDERPLTPVRIAVLPFTVIKWLTTRTEPIDQGHVADLAAALSGGATLPMMAVVEDGAGTYWGFRGEYTAKAHEKLGRKDAEFEVSTGTRADALFAAAQENKEDDDRRGKKRTKACKMKAIDIVLERFSTADRKLPVPIAEVVRLTGTYPSLVREQMGILKISRDEEGVFVRRSGQKYRQKSAAPGLLDALKFVEPAVSTGRESKYLLLDGGRVAAGNGVITKSAPVQVDVPPCRPLATELLDAVRALGGVVELELLDDGRLRVSREGSVRHVECSPGSFSLPSPSGAFLDDWPSLASMEG